jgi:hypothetical protein
MAEWNPPSLGYGGTSPPPQRLWRDKEMFLEGGCTSSRGLSQGRRVADLAALKAGVERAADGLGEARDFADLIHLLIYDFVVITINRENCGTRGKKPKTYGRFLGTIFAKMLETD